ncbi:hypothetical protein GRI97_08110 [Altererythrobacter xixiisoli]|uniref:Uncharacterized protein n=1 Tax=Croceibacterium xixiisoli TaxID=1476466 RepID=A0A6I4TUT6_9SPHN|nr:hypothetical protein [Croceibacterium xixiisoli]MXO98950.1 hypothetical protein [Croceibacterium xixiisoli]
MALPNFAAFAARLRRTSVDVLGDAIQYRAAGSVAFVSLQAHVDYRDLAQGFDASQVIEQNIQISVIKTDVPAKPSKDARITLPKAPGLLFRPENVRSNKSGTRWDFELRIVSV